jgi:hypothetical protein
MHRKRRQGGRRDALNAPGSAKCAGARGFQALAHFGGKPVHRLKIEGCSNGRLSSRSRRRRSASCLRARAGAPVPDRVFARIRVALVR